MSKNKIVIIATAGLTTSLLYQKLSSEGFMVELILENPESNFIKIKRRFKKLPFFNVLGQLFFLLLIVPFLRWSSRKRITDLVSANGYNTEPLASNNIKRIESVNSKMVLKLISDIKPDFIFLNGTRIMKKNILDQIAIPVLNIHVGITPEYRGIHGGYWALYNKRNSDFGVTFHFVDAGVDTGKIISQKIIEVDKRDNFISYPVLQFIVGLELASQFLNGEKQHKDSTEVAISESKQYYHPTFFQYLIRRFRNGVK